MRKRHLGFIVALAIISVMITYALPAAASIQSVSGFEAADGDMVPNAGTQNFDWNNFGPLCSTDNHSDAFCTTQGTLDWHGTAPYRTTTDSSGTNIVKSGWTFIGLEDAQNSGTDTGFGGGTKEDDECPAVNPGNAPNKDDMKGVYMATKTGSDGHPYLMLSWTRIPLNTTQSSTHLAFEFDQNQGFSSTGANYNPCGAGSDGLVHRKAGDVLILYDFGGSNTFPTIGIQFWVAKGGTCAVANHTGKQACWGPETSPLPSSTAVAAVDEGTVTNKQGETVGTFPTSTLNCLSPVNNCSDASTGTADTLGLMEFGEAGIDLQTAGVFTPGQCETFGTASAVSRTSGDSGNSAMEDLVGPGHLQLTNCGEVKIIKHTDPRGIDKNFSYSTTIPGSGTLAATFGKTPDTTSISGATFTLNDKNNAGPPATDSADNTEDITNVQPNNYTVTETVPSAYSLESLSCTSSGGNSGTQHAAGSPQADITVVAGGVTTCTFQNQQQIGAIKIIKTGKYVACPSPSPSASPSAIPSPYASLGVCSANRTAQLAGAHFKIQLKNTTTNTYSDVTGATDLQTGSDGTVCFSSADIINGKTYGVTEVTPPPGYANDAGTTITDVTITDTGTCSTGKQKTATFTDTPKTDLTVTARPEAGNATNSTISCGPAPAPSTTAGPTPRPTYSATGLTPSPSPSVYTCNVVVDP